jgi:hypothetical protein
MRTHTHILIKITIEIHVKEDEGLLMKSNLIVRQDHYYRLRNVEIGNYFVLMNLKIEKKRKGRFDFCFIFNYYYCKK